MKKYIDCDKLVKVLKDCVSPNVMAFLQEQVIDFLPAEDVELVAHGKWLYGGDNGDEIEPDEHGNVQAYCSRCCAGDVHAERNVHKVPFCWNCGAKMEGGQG